MESFTDFEARKIVDKALPYSRAMVILTLEAIETAKAKGFDLKPGDAAAIAQMAIDFSEGIVVGCSEGCDG